MAQDTYLDSSYNPIMPGEMDPEEEARRRREQQQQASTASPIDWGSVESQLREYGGNLYDPSDLEGIRRNTGYDVGGVGLDAALASQRSIYDQRRSSNGGGQQSAAQQWNAQPVAAAPTTIPVNTEQKAKSDELWRILMERATQGLAVDRNTPVIRQQADAFSANEERSKRDYLADIAEKSGPFANLRGETRLASERVGQRTGSFEAELMARELTAKRQEISEALTTLAGRLTSEQEMDLRGQLALLDNAIKQQQVGLQSQQLGQDWQKALLQNDQFIADLGLRSEDRASYWDAVRRGLL